MARYWVYLNNEVAGPFGVEQLIRLRNFSRQTMVCVDDASGKPSQWISPAEIPELAHIFKAADEHQAPAMPGRASGDGLKYPAGTFKRRNSRRPRAWWKTRGCLP